VTGRKGERAAERRGEWAIGRFGEVKILVKLNDLTEPALKDVKSEGG